MKCRAYIDPATGIALDGEALVNASKNSDAPRCGYELEVGDRFCPSCGASAEMSSVGISSAGNKKPESKRAARAVYWGSVAAFFLTNVLYFALTGENLEAMNGLFVKVLGYVNMFAYVYFVKTSVRRLHDIERSGWLIAPSVCLTIVASILAVISLVTQSDNAVLAVFEWGAIIVNLGMVAWLGFAKGTKGPNKYGPDPVEFKRKA